MNVKLHTPKTLKTGSGLSSAKQFFMALLATTISIILTFGTAAVIDHYKKQADKKQMVMMVIDDFDKTIELIEKVDTGLRECRRLQQDIAIHPEHFDSLHYNFAAAMPWITDEFTETIEKIFSSSIETFSTIGDVNFVNEVSSFYLARRKYKEMVLDELKEQLVGNGAMQSIKSLFDVDFPEYVYMNGAFLKDMKADRNRCMRMMNVSEEDLITFNKKQTSKEVSPEDAAFVDKLVEEYQSYQVVLEQAKEKLKD